MHQLFRGLGSLLSGVVLALFLVVVAFVVLLVVTLIMAVV